MIANEKPVFERIFHHHTVCVHVYYSVHVSDKLILTIGVRHDRESNSVSRGCMSSTLPPAWPTLRSHGLNDQVMIECSRRRIEPNSRAVIIILAYCNVNETGSAPVHSKTTD